MMRLIAGLTGLVATGAALFAIPFISGQVLHPGAVAASQPPRPGGSDFGPPEPGGPGFFGPPPFPLMLTLDTNGDGELTEDELNAAPEALIRIDKNKDGQLTVDELMPDFAAFPGGGFGGPRGPMGVERQLVKKFDRDNDGRLNAEERKAAREETAGNGGGGGRRPAGFGGPGRGRSLGPPQKGEPLKPEDVPVYPEAELYAADVLRTLFIDFDSEDWEEELAAFNNTDVDVPATLTVDGKTYHGVGVHFRGMSSFMAVPAGYKRSLNVTIDFTDKKQNLYGYRTLNLLNAHEDPSFMSSILYSRIARRYIPAPKASFVRVVINGEDWGIYPSLQQFNRDFLKENFGTSRGTRWKVSGSPMADGGLRYHAEDLAEYRQRYSIRSEENEDAWKALVRLCRTLDQTPPEQLEEALAPIVDIDNLLWFLALDNTLINNDGYWVRASDYSIYLGEDGRFRFIPHDMNEAFNGVMGGPGMRGPGGGGGGNVRLEPLTGLDDARKPLRSKVLAVPALRDRYLQCVRTIAEESLNWETLSPVIEQYRELIAPVLESDRKKLSTYEEFLTATAAIPSEQPLGGGDRGPGRHMPLGKFFRERRQYLLEHPEIVNVSSITIVPGGTSAASNPQSPPEPEKQVPAVVLNELMASNEKTIADADGNYGDWIELYNAGTSDADISEMFLTDSAAVPRKWKIPAQTIVPAGGFLIIWADERGKASSGLHLNFKLSAAGEEILLIDRDGATTVDAIRFEKQTTDVAFGRYPDGAGSWQPLFATPGHTNRNRE